MYALVIQIIHKRVKRVIYTPYQLGADEYDPVQQNAVFFDSRLHTRQQIKEINKFVKMKRKEIGKILDEIAMANKDFTAEDVVLKYRLSQSDKYLLTFMERHIAKKEAQGKMGSARTFQATLQSLKKYIGDRLIEFVDIDYHFVKGYEDFLYKRNIKLNTIGFYLRNFRTVYNQAYDDGVNMKNHDAFHKIKIKTVRTVKRALKQERIIQIARLDLTESPSLDKARDLFMFSFYTRGMSFVDIIYLKHTDIVDGVIRYHRQKTNQYMEVAITPPLQKLINKYRADPTYVLPFVVADSFPILYEQYLAIYGVLYRDLNRLQKILNLNTPLTTYVARHSWATIAKEQGASTTIISESLGHASEKTTRIYLKDFDRSVIDRINEKIVSFPFH